MKLKEGLLALIETKSSLEYKLEEEASTSSVLLLYMTLSLTLPPLSSLSTPIDSLPFHYNISQHEST